MAKDSITILICDDQEVVRIGLATLLSQEPNFKVIGYATAAEEVVEKAKETRPHIIIMDITIPGDGIKACYQITAMFKETKILILTSSLNSGEDLLIDAIMAGVKGYFLKKTPGEELVEIVKQIHQGKSLLDPAMTEKVFEYIRKPQGVRPIHTDLSEQEEQILDLLTQGLTNQEIADRIHLAERTVRNYVSNILKKLDLKNRVEAATYMTKKKYNQYQ